MLQIESDLTNFESGIELFLIDLVNEDELECKNEMAID